MTMTSTEITAIVWLHHPRGDDANVRKRLRRLTGVVKVFDDVGRTKEYLRKTSKDERMIFVVNEELGKEIVAEVHSLSQIVAIYLFGVKKKTKRETSDWFHSLDKLRGVSETMDTVVDDLLFDHLNRKIDEGLSIDVFQPSADQTDQSSGLLNGQFIEGQLLIDCLMKMSPRETEKNELIQLSRQFYSANETELDLIDEFERDYRCDRAVWWYTRESFLYRLLNRSLRVRNLDVLFLFRFFIRHLHDQLEELQCSTPRRVYRGQLMSNEELQRLTESVDQLISLHSFLSTSLDRDLALSFLQNSAASADLQRVLFEIDLDPTISKRKPFAEITSQSFFSDEREVLVMLGSIFRLVSIERQGNISIIRLILASDDDNDLHAIFKSLREEYGEGEEQSSLFSFGVLLFKMGQYDQAEHYYHRLLRELPRDHPDLPACYHNLAMMDNHRGLYQQSEQSFNKALSMYNETLPNDHPILAKTLNSLGELQLRQGRRTEALQSFTKALNIRKKIFADDDLLLAKSYHNLGQVHQEERELQQAFEYHHKSFLIRQKHLPPNHPDLGSTLCSLATIYLLSNDPRQALDYYQRALHIYQKSLPDTHCDVAMLYYNLGLLFNGQNQLDEALKHFQKASKIFKASLSSTHPFVIRVQRDIDKLSPALHRPNPINE